MSRQKAISKLTPRQQPASAEAAPPTPIPEAEGAPTAAPPATDPETTTDRADAARQSALRSQREAREAFESGKEPPGWKESRDRVHALANSLKHDLVDREFAIDGLLAAMISRAGCVLLGPPGTAKSLLVRRIAERCDLRIGTDDANYFEYLLTAHTMPEEIFGPTDIGLLLQQPPLVRRVTAARLPHAELAFLDEVFRGGSHILNTLLTILNERKFHNGRQIEDVPLVSFIGAANQPPQTEDLKAFFDRFPVRIWVDSVLEVPPARQAERGLKLLQSDGRKAPEPKAANDRPSMSDFRKLWSVLRLKMSRASDQVRLATASSEAARLKEFTEHFKRFQSTGELSDRSFVQLWYFAGALDMVAKREPDKGQAEGATGHIECFKYVAPSKQALQAIVQSLATHAPRRAAAGA